jgi:integrase
MARKAGRTKAAVSASYPFLKVPKYRRHAGRDRAFVEYNRKRVYLKGPYKSPESIKEYRKFLDENVYVEFATAPSPTKLTVSQLADRFQAWADSTYPPGTRSEAANVRAALAPLRTLYGDAPASSLTPVELKAIQNHLAKRKRSRGYVNACCARIKRCYKWAAVEGLVPDTVYNALALVPGLRRGRSPAVEPAKREAVAWEQVAAVLPELSATVAAMVQLQWLTGVRSQSLCQARASQFDTKVQPWEWRPRHKTEGLGHELVVFVGPQAQAILSPYLASRKDYLFAPLHLGGVRAKGYRSFYDSVSYLRAISRAQDRINAKRVEQGLTPLPRWTPHQIRHAKATAVRVTHGLEGAQAALGHQTISATQIYAARQAELARQIAAEHG